LLPHVGWLIRPSPRIPAERIGNMPLTPGPAKNREVEVNPPVVVSKVAIYYRRTANSANRLPSFDLGTHF